MHNHYQRRGQIEEAPLSGELMLFDPESGRFFVLNRTMASIWRRCDGESEIEAIIEELNRDFRGVDPGAAAADVRRALDELVSLGLVHEAASQVAPGPNADPRRMEC